MKSKYSRFAVLLIATLLASVSRAQTIPNPSFELDHYFTGAGYASQNGDVITGWVISNTSRIGLNIGGTNDSGLFVDNGAIPDGTNVAFIQSNGTTNSLSTTISGLLQGAQYQVTFRANCRDSGYSPPLASWSINGGAFVPITCSPAVLGSNPYYTNSATFSATGATAALVLENGTTNHDTAVLLDDFTIQILPQTLLHYRVNATDAAAVATGSIPSLGTLGTGSGGGSGVTLTNDIPADGVPPGAGDSAIVCSGSGGILAPDTEQLNRTNISNAGGFTYEAWFKWNGGGSINAIIDYAGTEKLIRQSTDAGASMETDNAFFNQIGAAAANQWHYVAVVFTPTNTVTASDSVSGYYTFYLDTNTPMATVPGITINNFGDSLNQTIGVGMHPAGFSSDYFHGLIYEPRVSLGALPGSSLLFKSTYTVTNLADSGPGTLRDAADNSATTPIIHFAPALSGQTIYVSSGNGPISLNNNVTIDGSTLPDGIHIDGGGSSQIFSVGIGGTMVLNSLTIENGNDSGDTSSGGGGIDAFDVGSLVVNNCAFIGNLDNNGHDGGGAIHLVVGTLTVNNCTFTGNQALNTDNGDGGGAVFAFSATVTVNGCTIVSNQAENGGGIFSYGGTLNANNSIVCSNTASVGANIDIPDGSFNAVGSLFSGDPLLAPLGNYGGLTPTMPPLPGSPAIDTGNDAAAAGLRTDQRGYPRIAGAHVDIGAVEGAYIAAGPGKMTNLTRLGDGSIQFGFTNGTDANFPVLAATNLSLAVSHWAQIGFATETPPGSGHYQFTDPQAATNYPQRFYRVKSP